MFMYSVALLLLEKVCLKGSCRYGVVKKYDQKPHILFTVQCSGVFAKVANGGTGFCQFQVVCQTVRCWRVGNVICTVGQLQWPLVLVGNDVRQFTKRVLSTIRGKNAL